MKLSRGKVFNKRKLAIGASFLTLVLGVGCYNVTYEILQAADSSGSETKKTFRSFGEVVKFDKNDGRLMIKANQDSAGTESIPYNNGLRIPTSVLIPAGEKLPNGETVGPQGRLVAVGDARWTNNSDLPQKASAWLRYSDDGGKNWSKPQLAVHFDDYDMSTASGLTMDGVVTGDPTIGRTATNRLIMLSTFGGTSTGNWTSGWSNRGDGLDKFGDAYFQEGNTTDMWKIGVEEENKFYLRLRKNTKEYFNHNDTQLEKASVAGTINGVEIYNGPISDGAVNTGDWKAEEYAATDSVYCYYVPVEGGEIMKASGNGTTNGAQGVGLYVDENYFLYLDKEYRYPYYVKQLKKEGGTVKLGDKDVHCHLFMGLSPYQTWRGCTYIGMSYSDDGGVTWTPHRDITYMVRPKEHSGRNTRFFFVSPTGGYLHDGLTEDAAKTQGNNNRLIFSAYNNSNGVAVFWTDDNGDTWSYATNGQVGDEYVQAESETTIVGHPNGGLIAISRGTPPKWAVSNDGGVTWTSKGDLSTVIPTISNRNLMSAVVLDWTMSPSGHPLIALSSATGGARSNGYVFLVTIEPEGDSYKLNPYWNGPITKINITPGDYAYSSVCELANGNLAVFYEGSNSDYYVSFVEMERN